MRDAVEDFLFDERQTHRALSRVVCDGVGDEADVTFPGNLLHDLCLSDAGRAHQKDGTLADFRNPVLAEFVFVQIGPDGIFDIFLCFLYIHRLLSPK